MPVDYNWKPKTLRNAMDQIIYPGRSVSPEQFDMYGYEDAAFVLGAMQEGRVLDFGCGIGRILRNLPVARFTGYEPYAEMRGFAAEYAPKAKIIGSLEGYENYFDGAYEFLVFQHIAGGGHAKDRELLRAVVKPGGLLLSTGGKVPGFKVVRRVKYWHHGGIYIMRKNE